MSTVTVRELRVEVAATGAPIVSGASLEIRSGEVLGIVGESGSGKSTLALALLGFTRPGATITGGEVVVGGRSLLTLGAEELRGIRGDLVSYVPQDPGTALNPALTLGVQLTERLTRPDAQSHVKQLLAEVGLPSSDDFLARYPGQLSGGQQQRVAIAMAVAPGPTLLVLDEPTTGLDVTTQLKVLDLVARLTRDHQMAAVYISHDLAVVGHVADRIGVLYRGEVVEQGTADQVLRSGSHPYTVELVSAVPSVRDRAAQALEPAPDDRPIALRVQQLGADYGERPVLSGVDLDIATGECVAVVGESGSGKSTMSRCLMGLHPSHSGHVLLNGEELNPKAGHRSREARRRVQYVFQNPFASLPPRMTVGDAVALPLTFFGVVGRRGSRKLVLEALDRVRLPATMLDRYPAELSGGQRQRVAIARALAPDPTVLVCDEITSALDVSVQASILDLLRSLHADGLSSLFITHNLAVVAAVSDRVAVLERGVIVEQGPTDVVLGAPQAEYTRRLLSDTLDIADYRRAPQA